MKISEIVRISEDKNLTRSQGLAHPKMPDMDTLVVAIDQGGGLSVKQLVNDLVKPLNAEEFFYAQRAISSKAVKLVRQGRAVRQHLDGQYIYYPTSYKPASTVSWSSPGVKTSYLCPDCGRKFKNLKARGAHSRVHLPAGAVADKPTLLASAATSSLRDTAMEYIWATDSVDDLPALKRFINWHEGGPSEQ